MPAIFRRGIAGIIYRGKRSHPQKLVFSGDIGRRHQLLMEDPSIISEAISFLWNQLMAIVIIKGR